MNMESNTNTLEQTPPMPVTTAQYASIGRRFGALVLDSLVLIIPSLMMSQAIPFLGGIVIAFLYAPILESSAVKATLGKYWMGIQAVNLDGSQLTLRTAFLRNILKSVSGIICGLGYILAFFTQRKQTLHDLILDTVVVYGRYEGSVTDEWIDALKKLFRAQPKA